MHLGHQAVFNTLGRRLNELAEREGRRKIKVLLTFAPHPRVVLSGLSGKELDHRSHYWTLNSLSEKISFAQSVGFDYFFVIKFNKEFARLSPEEFAVSYLQQALHASLVVIGYDWGFGLNRKGSAKLLAELGEKLGFESAVVTPHLINGHRVSSSSIKEALGRGDLKQLAALLGRRFEVTGKTRPGRQRGRVMGFPTLNLRPIRALLPPDGVYATLVHYGDKTFPAVTNIGIRPTFAGPIEHLIETHLLVSDVRIGYGERIGVEFVGLLRREQKFGSVEELREQIAHDVERGRELLKSYLS